MIWATAAVAFYPALMSSPSSPSMETAPSFPLLRDHGGHLTSFQVANPVEHSSPVSAADKVRHERALHHQHQRSLRSHGHVLPVPTNGSLFCNNNGTQTVGDRQIEFGVPLTYDPAIDCHWQFFASAPTKFLTLVFTQAQLVSERDFVAVYAPHHIPTNKDSTLPTPSTGPSSVLTGDIFAPRASRHAVDDESLNVIFSGNPIMFGAPRITQAGFTAVVFDSTGGKCYNDCNSGTGQGNCNSNTALCDCKDGWFGADCSVAVPQLQLNQPVPINNVQAGHFRYFQFDIPHQHTHVLIEFSDSGHAESDAYLLLGHEPPTLDPATIIHADWYSWFFDNSDVHYIRANLTAGTYFIGVTNHKLRAKETMSGEIIVRVEGNPLAPHPPMLPCLKDCYGHGKCSAGICKCDPGYTGSHVSAETTCQFKIRDSAMDTKVSSSLRIGDWDYYKFTVTSNMAHKHEALMSFETTNNGAIGIVMVKKGSPPTLLPGSLPAFGSFDKDFGDEIGFSTAHGTFQSIRIPATDLAAGDYYVGVYNIWGFSTLYEQDSHTQLEYTLFTNLYGSGIPCPRSNGQFCSGHPCDFNTGKCKCPINFVSENCAHKAFQLPLNKTVEGALQIAHEQYFYLDVTTEMLGNGGKNLLFHLKHNQEKGYVLPFVVAKLGHSTFGTEKTFNDDHTFVSSFYNSPVHQILLDREELKAGVWYFKVENSRASAVEMEYAISVSVTDHLTCPTGKNGRECSGFGFCDSTLGRCSCAQGYTLEDCSAHGVIPWTSVPKQGNDVAHSLHSGLPAIPVDGWAFFSIPVACPNQILDIELAVWENGVAPLLSVSSSKLPMMVSEATQYFDFFSGKQNRLLTQKVVVRPCNPDGCMIHPLPHFGTVWSVGTPEPGLYYFGIYNDFYVAQKAITNYSISAITVGECGMEKRNKCADGFLGDSCSKVCPGIQLSQHFSNTPMARGTPCSSQGTCGLTGGPGGEAKCTCNAGYYGEACELTCPSANEVTCSGNGVCQNPDKQKTAAPTPNGLVAPPVPLPISKPVCKCSPGYTGPDCSLRCSSGCSGNGECSLVNNLARCMCQPGFVGFDCSLPCPAATSGGVCSGNGECALAVSKSGEQQAVCECRSGFAGNSCSVDLSAFPEVSPMANKGGPPKSSAAPSFSSNGATVVIAIVIAAALAGAALVVYKKGWIQQCRVGRSQKLIARGRLGSDEETIDLNLAVEEQIEGAEGFSATSGAISQMDDGLTVTV